MKLFAAACLLALVCAPALAVEVDLSTVLLDLEGQPITDCRKWDTTKSPPSCEWTANVTLGLVAVAALNVPEQGLPAEEQIRRGMLAQRIYIAKKLDLTADEVKLIKDLVTKRGLSPVAFVRVMEALDPASLKR